MGSIKPASGAVTPLVVVNQIALHCPMSQGGELAPISASLRVNFILEHGPWLLSHATCSSTHPPDWGELESLLFDECLSTEYISSKTKTKIMIKPENQGIH